MTKDKLKERVIEYAINYFSLNDIYIEERNGKFYVQLENNFLVEITFEEMKYRAIQMLESEINGINFM